MAPGLKRRFFQVLLLGLPALAGVAQLPPSPASPNVTSGPAAARTEGIESRGDQAMGFRHDAAAHHFYLLGDGGSIDVEASRGADAATRQAIRLRFNLRHQGDAAPETISGGTHGPPSTDGKCHESKSRKIKEWKNRGG
ncbi:MAG TPA: hypothetical protein VGD78_08545 [Chthoniobacterales bacterium]